MSCCGSGGVYQPPNLYSQTPPRSVTGVAQPKPGTIYRVTTPQGIVYERYTRWEAEQILGMRGGTLDIITEGQH